MFKPLALAALLSAVIVQAPSQVLAQVYSEKVLKELCKTFNDNYLAAGYYREVMLQGIAIARTPEIRAKNTNALRYMEKNCPYVL